MSWKNYWQQNEVSEIEGQRVAGADGEVHAAPRQRTPGQVSRGCPLKGMLSDLSHCYLHCIQRMIGPYKSPVEPSHGQRVFWKGL